MYGVVHAVDCCLHFLVATLELIDASVIRRANSAGCATPTAFYPASELPTQLRRRNSLVSLVTGGNRTHTVRPLKLSGHLRIGVLERRFHSLNLTLVHAVTRGDVAPFGDGLSDLFRDLSRLGVVELKIVSDREGSVE